MSFSNLAGLIPSGGRFKTIFYMMASICAIYFYSKVIKQKNIIPINYLGVLPVIITAFVALRVGSEFMSLAVFVPTFLWPIALSIEQSLGSLIF
jgi:asparagine N-glycosylation enzyme membrane subunit Stt3